MNGGILVFFPILSIATAQVINSSLRHGQFFCPGMREVVFTCVIHGSERITWTSDEYIRTRIQFVAEVDRPGTRTTENENVYAVFNGSEGQGDSRVLVSELHIVPSQGSVRNPSVQCVDVEGNNNRISFYTIFENPGVPQDLFAIQIKNSDDRCLVISSWLPPNNTGEAMVTNYTVYANGSVMETLDAAESTTNSVRISTLLNVTDCTTYDITVSALSPCNSTQTSPFQLDQSSRHEIDFMVNCESDRTLKGGTVDKKGSIVMITAGVVMFLSATLFY